jgi:hypothetical protein
VENDAIATLRRINYTRARLLLDEEEEVSSLLPPSLKSSLVRLLPTDEGDAGNTDDDGE